MKDLEEVLRATEDIIAATAGNLVMTPGYGPKEHTLRLKMSYTITACRQLRLMLKEFEEVDRYGPDSKK